MELNGMGKKLMNKNIIYEIKEGRGFIKEFVLSEGFYINGQLNGKGKKYNIVGQLVFEGEYLNGKKHGIGKEYRYGILRFEGEYLLYLLFKLTHFFKFLSYFNHISIEKKIFIFL